MTEFGIVYVAEEGRSHSLLHCSAEVPQQPRCLTAEHQQTPSHLLSLQFGAPVYLPFKALLNYLLVLLAI